jgi:hypothetical protein
MYEMVDHGYPRPAERTGNDSTALIVDAFVAADQRGRRSTLLAIEAGDRQRHRNAANSVPELTKDYAV